MINVLEIEFGGFKNVEKFRMDFSKDNMIGLVSENNYGKSNVLGALSFISEFIQASTNVKKAMMSDGGLIPLNKKIQNSNFFANIIFEYYQNDVSYYSIYSFEFEWVKQQKTGDPLGARIISERLISKLNDKKQKYQALINRTTDSCLYKASESGRCSTKIKENDCGLVINRLLAFPDLFFEKLVEEINIMTFYLESHLDARFAFVVNPIIPKDMQEFDLVKDNHQLPKQLHTLKIKDEACYKQIISKCEYLFSNIEYLSVEKLDIQGMPPSFPDGMGDIPFKIDNAIYVLYYRDKYLNQDLSFEQMSDGVKRIVLLLTNLVLAQKNQISLMAIEEPENSIHPKLLQAYIDIIKEFSNHMKLVFTSHSPYFVSTLNISNVMVGLPNEDGLAEFGALVNPKAFKALSAKLDETDGECVFNLLNDESSQLRDFWMQSGGE